MDTLIFSKGTITIRRTIGNFEKVIISNGVESIGDFAFASCSKLSEIDIPDSITTIGKWAFALCSSLSKITIPDSVTSIGEGAFINCTSLKTIYINKERDSLDLRCLEIPKDCKVYWRGEF